MSKRESVMIASSMAFMSGLAFAALWWWIVSVSLSKAVPLIEPTQGEGEGAKVAQGAPQALLEANGDLAQAYLEADEWVAARVKEHMGREIEPIWAYIADLGNRIASADRAFGEVQAEVEELKAKLEALGQAEESDQKLYIPQRNALKAHKDDKDSKETRKR